MPKWKLITGKIEHSVLVTNNLNARDAFGRMSHVWLAEYVHTSPYIGLNGTEDKGYHTLDGPSLLTRYCEIPQPEATENLDIAPCGFCGTAGECECPHHC